MLGSLPSFYFDVDHYYARLRPPIVVKMVVVIWAEIWYNIGRQMRLQAERFDWRQFGEVVEMTTPKMDWCCLRCEDGEEEKESLG